MTEDEAERVRETLREAMEYAQRLADLVLMFGLQVPPDPPRWLYV